MNKSCVFANRAVFLTVLIAFLSVQSSAAVPDTIIIDKTPLLYYHLPAAGIGKSGLIIYMHGGVSRFKDQEKLISPEPGALLEGNMEFLSVAHSEGYDVLLPIAYNQYNWLEHGGEQFIDELLKKYGKNYGQIYIAGFSDGATGAYRFFYNAPEKYDGVVVFNGYPQLQNYYKNVRHISGIEKKIIYASTRSDKVIPYEFLLVEFRRQQMLNWQTYFILRDGSHSFTAYKKEDLELTLQLLKSPEFEPLGTRSGYILIYPPIDGFIPDRVLKELYPFRKKTGKKYAMSSTEYQRGDYDEKEYSKLLSEGKTIRIREAHVDTSKLYSTPFIEFMAVIDGEKRMMKLRNWLSVKTW